MTTVRILKATPYLLGPNDDYATTLGAVMKKLNSAREKGQRGMDAAEAPKGQEAAASLIARAYASAAQSLAKPDMKHEAAPANDGLVAALRRASDSYDAMAAAANRENAEDWGAAKQRASKRDEEVRQRLRDLRSLGYAVG